jgi:hypothetical protein
MSPWRSAAPTAAASPTREFESPRAANRTAVAATFRFALDHRGHARRNTGGDCRDAPVVPTRFVTSLRVYNDEATTEPVHEDEEARSGHRDRDRPYRFGVRDQGNPPLAQPSSAGSAASFEKVVQRSRVVAAAEVATAADLRATGARRLRSGPLPRSGPIRGRAGA